jgi:abortive infection bacteriophage resistance protein
MDTRIDQATPYPGLEDILSAARFDKYLGWAGGNRNRAIELYTLNAQLSESFYTTLHMLEVSLRNRIHWVMSATESETWYDLPKYQANVIQADMLAKARNNLAEAKKQETPGAMVAALTFGYWTAMLGKEYEDLWQTILKAIARREDGRGLRRKDFSHSLGAIRTLRNRLAHHETILHWDLRKHHRNIMQMITWLSPIAAEWCQACCRFNIVYPEAGITLLSLTREVSAST